MGRRLTPWADYVLLAVERGPVRYDKLVGEAAGLVPPGRGYRQALIVRAGARRSEGLEIRTEQELVGRSKDETIRAGQRHITTTAINGLRRRGRIVIYDDNGVKMVRAGESTDTTPSRPLK